MTEWGFQKPDDRPAHDWLKPVSMEFTMQDVDPEVLGIITGGVIGTPPKPEFSLEITAPVKRTFWQWLRRKPKQYRTFYIPHATLAETPAQTEEELNNEH